METDLPLLLVLAQTRPQLRQPRIPLSPAPVRLHPWGMPLAPPEPYYADGAWQQRYTKAVESQGITFLFARRP